MTPAFPVPRYGEASISDVLPSVLAAMDAGGENRLGLAPTQRAVVLLVDGLGLVSMREHAAAAPYLSSMACTELTVGFPSTTATSMASLSTGVPAGQHGITGYTSYDEESGNVVNWLAWQPVGRKDDLRDRLVPEVVQPRSTMWELAADAGVSVSIANSRAFEGTGLTRAVFRGGRYHGCTTAGDAIAIAASVADHGHRSLVYAYISELDFVGHVRGASTDAWDAQLSLVDRHVELLADRLPPGTTLLVTSDHGMADMPADATVDADAPDSPLRNGVVALAGEPRMRHVHCEPGAAEDVLAIWTELLGERAWVITRDDAIASGLFGPIVSPTARGRIGDVLAMSRGDLGVVQRRRESRLSSLPGHHGSLTDRELLVPLLAVTR
ncbi:MAG TPA: nucleotide pyrophosphatase/phosphodiesterase family protein [Mycobacteriales bacterium]|nr:nucleotide pyrophosphatase/phosphodiesterase family protein [Mycobacteriales bacterium]